MLLVAGVFALAVLLTPHASMHNDFPVPNEENIMPDSWFSHQFRTTNDVSWNNRLSRWVLGNFNFHMTHHLFPNLSYVYAPEITEVIKDFALRNGFPCKSFSLSEALKCLYRLIRRNANPTAILEEDM